MTFTLVQSDIDAYKNDGDINYEGNILPIELTIRTNSAFARNPNVHNVATQIGHIHY